MHYFSLFYRFSIEESFFVGLDSIKVQLINLSHLAKCSFVETIFQQFGIQTGKQGLQGKSNFFQSIRKVSFVTSHGCTNNTDALLYTCVFSLFFYFDHFSFFFFFILAVLIICVSLLI